MTVLSVAKRGTDSDPTWDIKTDLDPEMLSIVGLSMYKKWVDFAMGRTSLNGKTLMHPTGKYASSITYRKTGASSIAIMALVTPSNPEAAILESGHKAIDLKQYFAKGIVIPMHRGAEGSYYGNHSDGYGPPRRSMTAFKKGNNIWASIRAQGASGVARIGDNPASWIIPEMPAYSPAATLVALLAKGSFHDV